MPTSSTPPFYYSEPQNFSQKYYQKDAGKTVGALILSTVTLGIFPLICLFVRTLWIKVAYTGCDAKQATVVVLEEFVTKKERVFYVQYFSSDGVRLKPCLYGKTSLSASPFIRLRIDAGDSWFLQYNEEEKRFVQLVEDNNKPPEVVYHSQEPSSSSTLKYQLFDDREICEQLAYGNNWINKDKDDEMEIVGYKKIHWRIAVLYLEYLLSAGIFWLFCYWHPFLPLKLTHKRCHLLKADTILLMASPNKKRPRQADFVFHPFIEDLFSSSCMLLVCSIIPLGFLILLGVLIFLYISLRPYYVRPVKHSSRDGQRVKLIAASASRNDLVDYFKGSCCSETAVHKFFTWQKVKYVWSGIAVDYDEPSMVLPLYRFERQGGFVAPDEVDTRNALVRLQFKHQILGVTPSLAFLQSCTGVSASQTSLFKGLLGVNKMDLPLTPLFLVFIREILTPFYIFQAFSVILWMIDLYQVYASIILILTSISAIWQIISFRLQEVALRKTMHKSSLVHVVRPEHNYETILVEPDVLVPGDVIVIPVSGCVLQCDAVLLSGTCLVDEAMLTGESVPVLKFALSPLKHGDKELLQVRKNERSILFCGTKVLQITNQGSADGRVRAVVIRTGFMTAKGELTRLILYPKPFDFEFAADSVKFVGIMSTIALIGVFYSLGIHISRKHSTKVTTFRSLDLITIAVPPALPIALTIGYMMAQRRLRKRSVYCTSPSAINVAGVVDVVCMDKTGTMTESGLDFEKLLPTADGHFTSQTAPDSLPDGQLLRCLVSCHSLALVEGKAIGDPIEEKMFEMAGWKLLDPSHHEKNYVHQPSGESYHPIAMVQPPPRQSAPLIGVVRQLPFSSHFQRMSVVASPIDGQPTDGMSLYLKGAPEMVVSICRITTVPADLDIHLGALTECGYRVLGLATKSLSRYKVADIVSADRSILERDLDFLGLLVFENKLKPETCDVIAKLKKANMRLIMLTGDNPLTAVSVARQAGFIDDVDQVLTVNAVAPSAETQDQPKLEYIEIKQSFPTKVKPAVKQKAMPRPPSNILDMVPIEPPHPMKLVVTGSSWAVIKQYFPEEVDKILMRGAVFARVNPNQKKEVVEGLQQLGFYAMMCGDGANDCGALRAACTGVSLSQAEASVASPFTSKIENISCVHLLIREGRCALVTSFGIFRFMLLYALIQFISAFIMYYVNGNLNQFGFLYTDLFLATTLVFTMAFTEAYEHLVADKPPSGLMDIRMLLSLIIQAILIIGFQVLTYLYCVYGNNYWFLPFNPTEADTEEESYYSFEYYSIFVMSIYQYPMMAFVLSKGIPFRKPMYTNWLFCLNLAINFASNLFVNFDPSPPFPKYPENLVNAEYKSFAELLYLPMPPSMEYRGVIFLFSCIFCFTSMLAEMIFVEREWLGNALTKCFRSLSRNPKGKLRKYQVLEEQLGTISIKWPPVVKHSAQGAATIFSHEHARPAGSYLHSQDPSASTQFLLSSDQNLLSSSSSDDILSRLTDISTVSPSGNQQ